MSSIFSGNFMVIFMAIFEAELGILGTNAIIFVGRIGLFFGSKNFKYSGFKGH
jgi:hypothetical protein